MQPVASEAGLNGAAPRTTSSVGRGSVTGAATAPQSALAAGPVDQRHPARRRPAPVPARRVRHRRRPHRAKATCRPSTSSSRRCGATCCQERAASPSAAEAALRRPATAELQRLVERQGAGARPGSARSSGSGTSTSSCSASASPSSRPGCWLRPHRARLLPGRRSCGSARPGRSRRRRRSPTCGPASRRPPSAAQHPAAPARPAAQPVPARPAALPPAGQPLDAGRDPARGQPQPAERPRAWSGRSRPIRARLRAAGLGRAGRRRSGRAGTGRLFADLCGLLLGGPAVVGSLMDVIGRAPRDRARPTARGRPTRRPTCAPSSASSCCAGWASPTRPTAYRRLWTRLYPDARAGQHSRGAAGQLARGRTRSWSTRSASGPSRRWAASRCARSCRFAPKEQQIVEEAAGRLAAGTDPGIIPERLVIGAARVALDRRLARPGVITKNFYRPWRGAEPP